jgi:hypothetical protein
LTVYLLAQRMKVLRARPSCLQNSRRESPLSSYLFSVSSHSALERRLIFFFGPGTVSASTICSPAWRGPIRNREREAGEERSCLTAYEHPAATGSHSLPLRVDTHNASWDHEPLGGLAPALFAEKLVAQNSSFELST